ncbi:MAG: AMP-binding protein [Burkholderiaceae bacterium]
MSRFRLPLEERVLGPLLRRRAEHDGDRIYLQCGGSAWSFRQTDAKARAVARGLRRLGVGKGDRVALLVRNSAEFVFAWFACALRGAVTVPVNVNYKGALLEYVLNDCAPVGVVIDRALLPELARLPAATLARIGWVAVIDESQAENVGLHAGNAGTRAESAGAHAERAGTPPLRCVDFSSLDEEAGDDPEVESSFADIHAVMYTSGTSGPSKGVVMPNAHFFSSGATFIAALDLRRDDVLFTNLPLFHGLASRLGVLPALVTGARVVIGQRFSASEFWKEVAAADATLAHTIFTIPAVLKRQAPGPYDRAHRLRAMFNAHHDPEFEERFGVRLIESYGMTETGQVICSSYEERRAGASGKVHEDWEVELFDEHDRPVPVGRIGEIVARPRLPCIMMREYLNKPLETLSALGNLWFHTGDYARRDDDGFFYFSGRKKEHIRRRGENISAFEIESVVDRHPDVIESAALPHPADTGGEDEVRLVAVLRQGAQLSASQLMDWLQQEIPYFMLPRYVEFAAVLPRTPTDKVEKYKLVERGLGPDAWDREAAGYQVRRQARR